MIIRKVYVASKRSSTYGTVKAISAALYTEAQSDSFVIKGIGDKNEQEWKLLSEHICDDLIMGLAQRYNLDAPRDWDPHVPLKDMWGKRFAILYRRFSGNSDFAVISAGPDGIYGTTDDIASADIGTISKWD